MAVKTKSGSTQNELVQCDLEFPSLQEQLKNLESADFDAVLSKVGKINEMTWQQVYVTSQRAIGEHLPAAIDYCLIDVLDFNPSNRLKEKTASDSDDKTFPDLPLPK